MVRGEVAFAQLPYVQPNVVSTYNPVGPQRCWPSSWPP